MGLNRDVCLVLIKPDLCEVVDAWNVALVGGFVKKKSNLDLVGIKQLEKVC